MSKLQAPTGLSIPAFLAGGGEAGRLIAALDWSRTAIGAIERWPPSLRTATSIVLNSSVPMVMLWGADGIMIYNDAYSAFAGGRHPKLLGSKVREGWPEVASFNDNVMRVGLAGGTLAYRDQELTLYRHGRAEQVWMNLDYSPVLDESGAPAGVVCIVAETTERVLAERRAQAEREALHRSERELRFALEAGRFGAWTLDLASLELTSSATCRTNFGRPPDEPFSYAELHEAVHPDDKVRMAAAIDRSIATRAEYDIEYRIVTPAGETRWIAIRARPAYADDGKPVGMAGVSIDITERKRTQERLIESESRYRTLFEAIDAGFCVVEVDLAAPGGRTDLRVAEANPAFYRQSGLPEAIAGRWLREAVPALEELWYETYGRIARTGEPERFDQASAALGRWFDVHAFRIGDAAERRVAILFNDISARRRDEERLRELNETLERLVVDRTAELRRFRDIVEATASPICAFDTEYRLIAFNKAHNDEFRRVNGFDTKLGDVFPDQFIPAQQPVMRALMARALSGERFTVTEEFGRPQFGQPLWEISYTPLCDERGSVIGAFHLAKDISDRLRAEADLAAAQEALRQSQKMEAMGSLTGGVAHDFNNLLTPIVGSLDLLQRKGLGGEREQRMIAGAIQSAERAKVLVQRLLAFARRQPLRAEAVDVESLVRGMAGLVASTSGPTVQVKIDIAPGLPPARADANQVEMAILNLAVNARDAMPDGGRLTIAAAPETADGPHRGDLAPGRYVRLSVADTGAGMDEATLKRAVEPFFSTKGIGKGTGLGLSMVHGLAAQLGGGLAISSRLGLGTVVELWLPASAEAVTAVDRDEPAPLPARSGTVLLVDDEELVRIATADMLVELGYAVVEASSAEEAMRLLEGGLSPDLLVTDHLMPGLSGTELVRRLDAERPVRALVVSGYAEVDGIAPDLPRLVKPFRQADLAAAIDRLIGASADESDAQRSIPAP